jgi:hypothetical protein
MLFFSYLQLSSAQDWHSAVNFLPTIPIPISSIKKELKLISKKLSTSIKPAIDSLQSDMMPTLLPFLYSIILKKLERSANNCIKAAKLHHHQEQVQTAAANEKKSK